MQGLLVNGNGENVCMCETEIFVGNGFRTGELMAMSNGWSTQEPVEDEG